MDPARVAHGRGGHCGVVIVELQIFRLNVVAAAVRISNVFVTEYLCKSFPVFFSSQQVENEDQQSSG